MKHGFDQKNNFTLDKEKEMEDSTRCIFTIDSEMWSLRSGLEDCEGGSDMVEDGGQECQDDQEHQTWTLPDSLEVLGTAETQSGLSE